MCQFKMFIQPICVSSLPVYELIDDVSFPSKLWSDMCVDPTMESNLSPLIEDPR